MESTAARIAAARQDASAAASLLEEYRNYLRFLARDGAGATLQTDLDVSDIVQDVVIRAAGGFQKFRGTTEAELLAWLRRILANRIVDIARKRAPGRNGAPAQRSIEELLYDSSMAFGRVLTASGTSPSRRLEQREASALVANALSEIEPDHQEVVRLRCIHAISWKEVGRRMRRSEGACQQLLIRALQALRPHLENYR